MCEGLGSLPKNPTFCLWVGLGGMRRLAFRPAILRWMLPETHTTQPTPTAHICGDTVIITTVWFDEPGRSILPKTLI